MRGKGDGVDESGAVAEGTTAIGEAVPGTAERRPMRADAVKNQKRILEAAEEVFALQGVAAPIDLVAERAGVGVGTIYRHFPTKEALFEAIVLTRLEELAAAATATDRTDGAGDPGEVLFSFLRLFAGQVGNKHDLVDALGAAGIDIKSRCSQVVDELESGVQRMLDQAQAAGAVRAGITTREVMGMVVGICQTNSPSDLDPASRDRMIGVVCDGLRPRPDAVTTPARGDIAPHRRTGQD
jgi:AcrR family transcriptional regulator